LSDTIRACRAAGADFTIARLESIRAEEALERSGIMHLLAADRLFQSVEEAIRAWQRRSGGPASPDLG
jgi:SulP family sulfate permease